MRRFAVLKDCALRVHGEVVNIEVQIIKYTRRAGELRVRRTFFVRRREVRLITPCNYLYELLEVELVT